MQGFTLNERHCERDMKIKYIPDAEDRAGFVADIDLQATQDSTRDGMVTHTIRRKEKDFKLSCFFEELSVDELRDIERWLHEPGELIFDHISFCSWYVIPNKEPDISKWPTWKSGRKVWSGTMTIYLIAPNPNAKLLMKNASSSMSDEYKQTGLLTSIYSTVNPSPDTTEFFVYNPGNVACGLSIRVSGNAGIGLTFTNRTNNSKCTFKGFSDLTVTADGETLRMIRHLEGGDRFAYEYHDDGYIWLSPCAPYEKQITVSYQSGSDTINSSSGKFRKCMEGQYAWIGGGWMKIVSVQNSQTAKLEAAASSSGSEATVIATVNRITVERKGGANVSSISLDFTPRVNIR